MISRPATLTGASTRATTNLELRIGHKVDRLVFFPKRSHKLGLEWRRRRYGRSSGGRSAAAQILTADFGGPLPADHDGFGAEFWRALRSGSQLYRDTKHARIQATARELWRF